MLGQINCTKSKYPAQSGKQLVSIQIGKIGGIHDDCFDRPRVVYYSLLRGHAWSG